MHIHIGLHHALITFAEVIVVGFFWRLIAMLNHMKTWAQAMAFVY